MYNVHLLCTYDGLHLARKNVSEEVYFQFEKKTASHSANQLTWYPQRSSYFILVSSSFGVSYALKRSTPRVTA